MSIISVAITNCGDGHSDSWEKLDLAEQLMNIKPDSALTIIEDIDTSTLKGEEELARYAILKSMALDKNWIDATTFDIINPAVKYYIKHGTADEKCRVLYYQGRIFQNQGNEDSAMEKFINAADLKNEITDSLLLANNFVAMGTLYFQQYKINKFIESNLEAAKLYCAAGNKPYGIMSYANVIDGYMMSNCRSSADSIISICRSLMQGNQDYEDILFSSFLSYVIKFGTPEETKKFLEEHKDRDLSQDDILNFAQGYSKIEEHEKAQNTISNIKIEGNVSDSLKYLATKTRIHEKMGDYKHALTFFRAYTIMQERYQNKLISQDLLFADKRHQLEKAHLIQIQNRDRIISAIICGSFVLLIIVGWIYYKLRLSRSEREITKKEIENLQLTQENIHKEKERIELERDKRTLEAHNLKLEQDNLRKENEKIALERDNKALEAKNLEIEKQRLVAEQRQHELEAANLLLEKKRLEEERDNLKKLLNKQKELSKPIQESIKMRLDILNSLLAKEISSNDNYAKPYNKWIESIFRDRNEFMNSTRLAFSASHPRLIKYLEQHELTIDEINYLCLYAIGLRGKEVGEYIQLKRHYNISCEIRKKLGIDVHETNIGKYIRRKMNEL